MWSLVALLFAFGAAQAQFNNPPGVEIWCGKAYEATNASFNPGGWFVKPPVSAVPLLDFRISSRMSLYLDGETSGSLLVAASVSNWVGRPFPDKRAHSTGEHIEKLTLEVQYFLNGNVLLGPNSSTVTISSGQAEVPIELDSIPVSLLPHSITAVATLRGTNATYYASTQLSKLPRQTSNASATRLDHLYGGLAVRKAHDNHWRPIFPYTYYGMLCHCHFGVCQVSVFASDVVNSTMDALLE